MPSLSEEISPKVSDGQRDFVKFQMAESPPPAEMHGQRGGSVPAPGNFYVNLPPLFLGHFSPIFPRFFPIFSPFPPSCPQDSGNRHQERSVAVEKRRVTLAIWVLLLAGVG